MKPLKAPKSEYNEVFHKSHLLKQRVAPSEIAMTDVLREVLIMKMLNHPNIVNLVEVIDDSNNDNFYMGLLNQPLYLRSIAHLEQLLNLLDVIIGDSESKSSAPKGSRLSVTEQQPDPESSTAKAEVNTDAAAVESQDDGAHKIDESVLASGRAVAVSNCSGSRSYIADSVGTTLEKVVGRAFPKEESVQERRATWSFSTGDELTIQWDPTTIISGMNFTLHNQNSSNSSMKLLKGRIMQYEMSKEVEEHDREDEHFVTLIRYMEENPTWKATTLLNWKLQVVELLSGEDAVFVLLLCLAIVRGIG